MQTGGLEEVGRRRFEIEGCLGRGGFGEVYRAVMHSAGGLSTEVAVKMLHRDLDPAGQAVQRLRDEGRLLARLNHPTILRVHDLVLLDGRISLVTEYIEGEDLGAVCTGPHRIPLRALLEVIAGVAGALHAAWTSPIAEGGAPLELVHRDIKPSNIRISRHGQVKLLDFGIARTDTVDREAKTQTNLMVGSPAYMAPERFTAKEVDPASDVFALGCALYEGVTGRRLFAEMSVLMISTLAIDRGRFEGHVEEHLGDLPGDLPQPVLDLLVAMLDHDPARRPDAHEVMARAEELADEIAGPSLARWCRKRPWPPVDLEAGALAGRAITEGTMTRADPVAPITSADALTDRADSLPPEESLASARPEPPSGGGARWGWIAAGGAAFVVLAALVIVIGGVAGVFARGWFEVPAEVGAEVQPDPTALDEASSGETAPGAGTVELLSEPRSVSVPTGGSDASVALPTEPAGGTAELSGAATPAPEPSGAASAVPEPEGTASADEPSAAPEPITSPGSADVPAPSTTEPAPDAAERAQVEALGDMAVALVAGDGERIALPSDVPPGAYGIEARFNGRDYAPGGAIAVEAGVSYAIRCSARMMRCDVR